MTYTFDVEFLDGTILHDIVQVEENPGTKAVEILTDDGEALSVAVRDEGRKLIRIYDWRDTDEVAILHLI